MSGAGYVCTFCDGEHPAVFLQTNLTNGQTIVSCDEDMPVVLTGALAATLGVEFGDLYDNVQRFQKRQVQKAGKATAGHAGTKDQPGPRARRAQDGDNAGSPNGTGSEVGMAGTDGGDGLAVDGPSAAGPAAQIPAGDQR